jgi:hypothetical protein
MNNDRRSVIVSSQRGIADRFRCRLSFITCHAIAVWTRRHSEALQAIGNARGAVAEDMIQYVQRWTLPIVSTSPRFCRQRGTPLTCGVVIIPGRISKIIHHSMRPRYNTCMPRCQCKGKFPKRTRIPGEKSGQGSAHGSPVSRLETLFNAQAISCIARNVRVLHSA